MPSLMAAWDGCAKQSRRRYGRIEGELLLVLGGLDQALLAIRSLIAGDLADWARLRKRARSGESACERDGCKKERM